MNETAGALTTGVQLISSDVRLVTGAFAVLQNDPSIGRAEALRRAEMTMLDPDRPPAFSHALFVAPSMSRHETVSRDRNRWHRPPTCGGRRLLAAVQKKSTRLHLTAVMMIHHRPAIVQFGDTMKRDQPPIQSDRRHAMAGARSGNAEENSR
jgi:hypothetical protein